MSNKEQSRGSSLREWIWPIYGAEHKIWLPMASMVGLILFNYTVMRNIKDSLVVNATGSSEIIFYLKGGLVMPLAILFFFIYSELASLFNKKTLFYIVVSAFLGFFVLFAAVLYPAHEYLHPTELADRLQSMAPSGLRGLIDVLRVWTFSLFYAMAELWGVAVSSLLFWQFANDVIRVKDAKRFYAHFYLLANVFVFFSGIVVNALSKVDENAAVADQWGPALNNLTMVIALSGLVIMAIYFYLNKFVFDAAYLAKVAQERKEKPKKKVKMSVMDGVRHILHSKYLGLIAILVVSYGITINLVEVSWKNQIGQYYATKNEYAAFMGMVSSTTGFATVLAIFVGSILLRKLGWRFAALATPVVLGATGAFFFITVMAPQLVSPIGLALGVSPLFLSVLIGATQNVISKSIKYALFDPTKEMSYIPLDDNSKIRGKAAVDVVANRFGKSGGGYIQIALVNFVGPLALVTPHLLGIFSFFALIWIVAVFALNKEFTKAVKKQEGGEEEKLGEAAV